VEEKTTDRTNKEKEALRICDEMEALLNNETYLRSFDSKTLQVGLTLGLFTQWPLTALDVTRLNPWEVESFKAAVHATRGYIYSEYSDKLDQAVKEYHIALDIMSGNAAKGNLALRGWNWVFGDPGKDLKINITIGMLKIARKQAKTTAELDRVVTQLEAFAYSKKVVIDGVEFKVNPRQKTEAKFELANAYIKYAEFALTMQTSPQKTVLVNKAKRALIVARELFSSELAWKAGHIMDTLTGLLSSQELQ
jgi:hypothetical protein